MERLREKSLFAGHSNTRRDASERVATHASKTKDNAVFGPSRGQRIFFASRLFLLYYVKRKIMQYFIPLGQNRRNKIPPFGEIGELRAKGAFIIP